MAEKEEKKPSLFSSLSSRLVQAIDPFYYEQSLVDSAKRFFKGETSDEYINRLQNQMYPTKLKQGSMKEWKEGDLASGRNLVQEAPIVAERMDMLAISSGQPQPFKTLKRSDYVPKGAEKGDKFYSFKDDRVRNQVIKGLKDKIPYMVKETKRRKAARAAGSEKEKDKKKGFNVGYQKDVDKGESDFVNPGVIGMARFQVGVGEDMKGKYISIYDKWDLDTKRGPLVEALADKILPGFHLYDRIYYDKPSLRKPKIEDNLMEAMKKV